MDFYANFKCISFMMFSHTHQKLRAWENLPYLKKGETPPKSHRILMKTTASDSECQKTLLQRFKAPICKNVEFFFCRRKITDACFFSSQGWLYQPSGPRSFFPQSHQIKILSHLVQHNRKYNNYVFEDDSQSPGEGQ